MKKHNIYVYPLEGKVIFPYHEYRFTISSHSYKRIFFVTQPITTIIWLDLLPNSMNLRIRRKLILLKGCRDLELCLRFRNLMLWLATRFLKELRSIMLTIWDSPSPGTFLPIQIPNSQLEQGRQQIPRNNRDIHRRDSQIDLNLLTQKLPLESQKVA